jgi:hypothetical protein
MSCYCYVGSFERGEIAQVSGFLFPPFVFFKKKSVFDGTELPFVLDGRLPVFKLFKVMDRGKLCCIEDAYAMSMFLQNVFESSQPLSLSHSGALFLSSCSEFATAVRDLGLIEFFLNREISLSAYTEAFTGRRDVLNAVGASTSITNLVEPLWLNLFGTKLSVPQSERGNAGSLLFAVLVFTAIGNVPRDEIVSAQQVLDHPAVIKFFKDRTTSPEHADIVFRCLLVLVRSREVMC